MVEGGETTGRLCVVVLEDVDVDDETGTCWNALVTSWRDIRDGAEGSGGGVAPSSDLTSCNEKGIDDKSSAIPSKEFVALIPDLVLPCDHKALSFSGSGLREGDPLEKSESGLVQLEL